MSNTTLRQYTNVNDGLAYVRIYINTQIILYLFLKKKSSFSFLVTKCPEDIPNGRLSADCAPYFGNKCTLTCNPGYTTQIGEVLCQGTWNVSSLEQLCKFLSWNRQGYRLKTSSPAVTSLQVDKFMNFFLRIWIENRVVWF